MTRQEMFDKAVRGLHAQGYRRAVVRDDEGGTACRYRAHGGLRCAVGHLIPDELYKRSFNGCALPAAAGGDLSGFPRALLAALDAICSRDQWPFLKELQRCHDNSETPEEVRERLANFAKRHRLTFPEGC